MAHTVVNPVEACRLIAVLEEALERCAFLSVVAPAATATGELTALVGEEVHRTLAAQRALEARYDELIEARTAAKAAANKAKLAEVAEALSSLSSDLRDGMRHLCRLLRDSPDVDSALAQLAEERGLLVGVLSDAVSELRESGSYSRLASYVARELDTRDASRKIAQRELDVVVEVKSVQETLLAEEAAFREHTTTKRAEIAAITTKLQRFAAENKTTLRFVRKEAAARGEAAGLAASLDESDAQRAIDALAAQLAVENDVAAVSAEVLRSQIAAATTACEQWRARLPVDLAAKEEELARLCEENEAQHAALLAYQKRYEDELQTLSDKLAEAEKIRADHAAAEALREEQIRAAHTLNVFTAPVFVAVKVALDEAQAIKEAKKAAAKPGGKK